MKRMTLIAALSASPAFAQNIDVFVVQDDGSGVVQQESNVTLQEAEILIGKASPPGTTGVVLQRGEPTRWTDQPPSSVNANYGGDGDPYIVDERDQRDDETADDDMTFDAEEEDRAREELERDDIEFEEVEDLFPEPDPMGSTRIQPRDGRWAIEIRDQKFTGCPAAIAAAAGAQVDALQMSSNTGIFGPNFTPEQMAPQLEWTKVGGNSWFGSFSLPSGQAGASMQWGVQVISETLINHRQELTFMGAGLGACTVNTFVTAYWVS